MPFTTSPQPNSHTPSEPLPQHLGHKPVYALPYEEFDGIHANKTDIRYLSVGIAQYDADQVSIKAMRYTGTKWTRQAEELPIHRVIDMCLLLTKVLFGAQNNEVNVPAETFSNQTNDIRIVMEDRNYGETASFNEFLIKNNDFYKRRLNVLFEELENLKKAGKI
jgi:hypothetical protein